MPTCPSRWSRSSPRLTYLQLPRHQQHPRSHAKTGRILAAFALLLSLVAIGGSGYLVYLAWLTEPDARFEAAIGAYQGDLANYHRATTEEVATLREELAGLGEELAAQRHALEEARAAMADTIVDNVASAPPTPREWRLAEVEYLLTVANHRLLLQDDAKGAERLLALSDGVLADLDDYRFHEVRALLAEERLSLKTFDYADTQGVFLRLEAVKESLNRLPLRLPEYADDDVSPGDSQGRINARCVAQPSWRSRPVPPARWRSHPSRCWRRRKPSISSSTCASHSSGLSSRYCVGTRRSSKSACAPPKLGCIDSSTPAAQRLQKRWGELDELQRIALDVPPPDISRSLGRFRELRRNHDDQVPST